MSYGGGDFWVRNFNFDHRIGDATTDEEQSSWMNAAHPAGGGWHGWAGVRSAYVKASDRYMSQDNCYTGRGQFYTGILAVTKNGNACEKGTFCRNPKASEKKMPFCKEADSGEEVDCQIQRCDEIYGKFAGSIQFYINRGFKIFYQ